MELSKKPYSRGLQNRLKLLVNQLIGVHQFFTRAYSFPLSQYFINFQNNIKFIFKLECISADSSTIILALLNNTIKKANEKRVECSIDWYFEIDDDAIS
jgi:hypothetical protein